MRAEAFDAINWMRVPELLAWREYRVERIAKCLRGGVAPRREMATRAASASSYAQTVCDPVPSPDGKRIAGLMSQASYFLGLDKTAAQRLQRLT